MGNCAPFGNKSTDGLKLHFAGIKAPKSCKSTLNLVDTVSIITINSSITINDTISNLKKLIRKTYRISSGTDILILYANTIISKNDELTLKHVNVTDNSLLLLAINDDNDQYKSYISSIISTQNKDNDIALSQSPDVTPPFTFIPIRLMDFEASPPPFIINGLQSPRRGTPRLIDTMQFSDDDSDLSTDTDDDEKETRINPNIHTTIRLPRHNTLHRRTASIFDVPPITLSPRFMLNNTSTPPLLRVPNNTLSVPQIPILSLNDILPNTETVHNVSPTKRDSVSDDVKIESCSSSSSDIDYMKARKGFDIITQETDVLVYKMPKCGHLMNGESLYEYALSVFNDNNNIYLKCPHSMKDNGLWSCDQCTFNNKDNIMHCIMCGSLKCDANKMFCDTKWEYTEIKKIFYNKLDDKLCKLEVFASRNLVLNECNVQKCSECDSLYFRENINNEYKINNNDLEKVFKTKCVLCFNTYFCWKCGVKWQNGHFCDASFRLELIEILANAETKKIGEVEDVPSIRCCPNCTQLINHSEACKHMKCSKCKTDFCFVCLKLKKGDHWQCGSHSDKCPVAQTQNAQTLPDSVDIHRKSFKLF